MELKTDEVETGRTDQPENGMVDKGEVCKQRRKRFTASMGLLRESNSERG